MGRISNISLAVVLGCMSALVVRGNNRAWAWGNEGHEIVAMIAADLLTLTICDLWEFSWPSSGPYDWRGRRGRGVVFCTEGDRGKGTGERGRSPQPSGCESDFS